MSSSCSAAWTRAVSDSRVSSGWIGDGGRPSTGPSSTPSSGTRWTITPVAVRSPARASCQARSMAWMPGSSPGSAGCRLTTRAGEPAEEAHREDAHPAGEHDEVGTEAGDDVGEPGVVLGSGLTGVAPDVDGRDPGLAGPHEGVGRRPGRRRRRRRWPAGGRSRARIDESPAGCCRSPRPAPRDESPAWFDARRVPRQAHGSLTKSSTPPRSGPRGPDLGGARARCCATRQRRGRRSGRASGPAAAPRGPSARGTPGPARRRARRSSVMSSRRPPPAGRRQPRCRARRPSRTACAGPGRPRPGGRWRRCCRARSRCGRCRRPWPVGRRRAGRRSTGRRRRRAPGRRRPTRGWRRAAMRPRRLGAVGDSVVRARSSVVSATFWSSLVAAPRPAGGEAPPPPVTTHTRSARATPWIPRLARVTRHVSSEVARCGRGGHRAADRRTPTATGPGSPCPSMTIAAPRRRRRSPSPWRARPASASVRRSGRPRPAHQAQREAELSARATPPQRRARGCRRVSLSGAAMMSGRTSRGRAPTCAASVSPATATTGLSTTYRRAAAACGRPAWRASGESTRRVLVGLGGWWPLRGAGGRGVVAGRAVDAELTMIEVVEPDRPAYDVPASAHLRWVADDMPRPVAWSTPSPPAAPTPAWPATCPLDRSPWSTPPSPGWPDAAP